MNTVSNAFDAPWAAQMDREHMDKYGTCDQDCIELIEEYAKKNIEKRATELANEKAEARFNTIKDEYRLNVIKEVNQASISEKGNKLSKSSPFVSDFVDVDGRRLYRTDFIPDTFRRDPPYSDQRLELNMYNNHWQKNFKSKGPEYISNIHVVGGYIVNPSALGVCDSFVFFINGKNTPLHFKNGNLSTHQIIKALQLEATSPKKEWVAEAFKCSLIRCPNIKFITIPERMGGNRLPDGSLTYVSSSSIIPGLEEYFPNAVKSHKLVQHERSFEEVRKDYSLALPNNWKAKSVVVDIITSILLPFYEEEGLRPDRVKIISYEGETVKHGFIALSKNVNYESTVIKSFTDRRIDFKKDLASANDINVIYTFSSTIEGRRAYSNKFTDIRLDLQGENGIENPTRKVITILTKTPGSIPEDLPAYFLSIDENIEFGDIVKLQQLTGEFDFSLLSLVYNNQDTVRLIVRESIEKAHSNLKIIRNIEHSQTMIMTLATVHILKEIGLLSDNDLSIMIRWLSQKTASQTTVCDWLSYDIRAAINRSICSGDLRISNQLEPPYYRNDGRTAFIADSDGSINVESDTFEELFLAKIRSTERRNLVLRTLNEKRQLISTKDHKRDLKVKFENSSEATIRVYSLSNAILSDEARKMVQKSHISDRFHPIDGSIENFYPYIVHPEYNMSAGQVIKDYNATNPFIAVSGSPGSGKTDFLIIQSLQRAKAGDVVIILDPTNSFCKHELITHKIPKELIDEHFVFWDMSAKGFPIDIIDFKNCNNIYQKRERLYSMLVSGSHFTGCNQLSILKHAVERMVERIMRGEKNICKCIANAFDNTNKETMVMNRVLSIFSTVANSTETPPGWDKLLADKGKIIVVSTGSATVRADVNPLDIIADHFYSYKDAQRAGNVTVILDEIQTMNLNEGAPIDVLLSKGRKLNIAAFLASQKYSNGKDRLGRVYDYCDTKIFFKPMESCINSVSEKAHIPIDKLRNFDQGECAIVGPTFSKYFGKNISVSKALLGKTYRPPYVGKYPISV